MSVEDFFWIAVVVVSFVASALSKLVREANKRRHASRSENPADWSEDIRMAKRRSAAPRPVAPQQGPPQIEDMLRRLMGQEPMEGPAARNDEAREGEWKPIPPPVRRAPPPPTLQRVPPQRTAPATPPRQMYDPPPRRQTPMPQRPAPPPPSARPVRQRPARTPQEMVSQPRRAVRQNEEALPIEVEQRENERRWREEMEQRKKLQAAQQAQQAQRHAPEVLHARARLMPARRRLFHSAGEVRRAIILSEVLGPPRAMRDLEERV